ncbi:MAG: L-serine ammonia-lyase, iron-sulfur-dependent, subunit alpha [Anaerolineae bacterium]|nr:L-serine ammonia-lyase, iron-sulfur-dependent, subunit alpha [Anaerolineae bacterium]
MRGPSSSHCAASVRIGRLARDLMDGQIERVLVEYDAGGSLATTHDSQGSDMGLLGGLLGWDAADERLPGSAAAIAGAGIEVCIRISEYGAAHPNTYKLTLANGAEQHQMIALSTGGGMIEAVEIDGARVSMRGDCYETLIYLDADAAETLGELSGQIDADEIHLLNGASASLIEIKGQGFPDPEVLARLRARYGARRVKILSPVLPVLSRKDLRVPFITCREMLAYNEARGLDLWELALHYESARGDLSPEQVLEEMRGLVRVMEESIRQGIQGTDYADRILGVQSAPFRAAMEERRLLDGGVLDLIILYVTALMEVKSSMGVIVAAPTAGACGALPGACIGAAHAMGSSLEEMTRAMLAAGIIGVFIAAHATFAAEVGGCQAECGAASGMAAAALVTLARGSTGQATDAASMALQNVLGMVCDPVANRVEVPCLGKNVMAAGNALACANMALAGFDAVIPLDEVIEAMDRVGKSLPHELRCTALGGLSTTQTSEEIERRLSRSRAGAATASPAR